MWLVLRELTYLSPSVPLKKGGGGEHAYPSTICWRQGPASCSSLEATDYYQMLLFNHICQQYAIIQTLLTLAIWFARSALRFLEPNWTQFLVHRRSFLDWLPCRRGMKEKWEEWWSRRKGVDVAVLLPSTCNQLSDAQEHHFFTLYLAQKDNLHSAFSIPLSHLHISSSVEADCVSKKRDKVQN